MMWSEIKWNKTKWHQVQVSRRSLGPCLPPLLANSPRVEREAHGDSEGKTRNEHSHCVRHCPMHVRSFITKGSRRNSSIKTPIIVMLLFNASLSRVKHLTHITSCGLHQLYVLEDILWMTRLNFHKVICLREITQPVDFTVVNLTCIRLILVLLDASLKEYTNIYAF